MATDPTYVPKQYQIIWQLCAWDPLERVEWQTPVWSCRICLPLYNPTLTPASVTLGFSVSHTHLIAIPIFAPLLHSVPILEYSPQSSPRIEH